ncbi:MAG TPA: oligosaccharide flippase family protein [Gallionellaceae bacterium]
MSLKRNILANYIGQIYVTLIGIVLVPVYIKYMGAEAYGLVGFFAMLQAWFMMLDMGLTPAMSRETARFRGGAIDAASLRRLLRTLEGIFIVVGALGAIAIITGAGYIATSWLKVRELPLSEVQQSIILMALIIALRWVCGLYRSTIGGFEQIVWLNGISVIIATVRFALIIPFLIYVGATPEKFFGYQLVVALVETLVFVTQAYRLMPVVDAGTPVSWEWQSLRSVLKFSFSIAFVSVVWVLITQTDKLILSSLLPLSDYAAFTLAVLVASGITLIGSPISGALLPRMARLNAEGDEAGLIRLYRNATQMVAVIVIPAALVLALFAEQVLWAWTGNAEIARKAAPVLALYAVGNGIMSLAAFPYYLQFAKGDLNLHMIGNAIFVVLFVPLLIWAAGKYGMEGAGYAWVTANLVPFMVWLPVVHRRFVKGLHAQWLFRDVCLIVVLPVVMAYVALRSITWPEAQLLAAAYLVILCIGLCMTAAVSSSWVREMLWHKWLAAPSR